jgi:hypothetical protein
MSGSHQASAPGVRRDRWTQEKKNASKLVIASIEARGPIAIFL